jgi:hypothetical protein
MQYVDFDQDDHQSRDVSWSVMLDRKLGAIVLRSADSCTTPSCSTSTLNPVVCGTRNAVSENLRKATTGTLEPLP